MIGMDDKRIEKKIRRITKNNNCKYTVDGGIVTIEGSVDSYDEFLRIGRSIGRLKGVIGVVNRLSYPGYKENRVKPKASMEDLGEADVVIIGGGVVGCSIARALSRYDIKVVLVEKNSDVATGTSKANNALVHTGIGEPMETLKQKLCVEGHNMFKKLAHELGIPYKENGLWIVISKDSLRIPIPYLFKYPILRFIIPYVIFRRGKKLGIPLVLVKRKKLLQMEPNITHRAVIALFSPTYAVTSPYLFTIALAENAMENGVRVLLDAEVVDIEVEKDRVKSVVTTKGVIKTRFIVNAAGLYVDEIAEMANTREYTIHPKRGATILFDKNMYGYINYPMSLLELPRQEHYKGGGVLYTYDGNIQWGPTIAEDPDRYDTSVRREEIEEIFDRYSILTPDFPRDTVITFFTGIRACTFTEDFIIRPARYTKGFIHVAGIQSPGLTAAPAIAEKVVEILKNEGLVLVEKKDFNPTRKHRIPILRELSMKDKNRLIEKNPSYGKIICRCEQVSEGEIIDAIHSPIPATTIDAIKRRTRAGMGRCQGGFCLPKIAGILSRETGIPLEDIMKENKGSYLFSGRTKRG